MVTTGLPRMFQLAKMASNTDGQQRLTKAKTCHNKLIANMLRHSTNQKVRGSSPFGCTTQKQLEIKQLRVTTKTSTEAIFALFDQVPETPEIQHFLGFPSLTSSVCYPVLLP